MRPSRFSVAITIASFVLFAGQSISIASLPDSLSSYFAANPIYTTTLASEQPKQTINANSPGLNILTRPSRCPASCSNTGSNPSDWTVYHHVSRLAQCNETMLLDFAIYNPLDNSSSHATIRSCTASFDTSNASDSAGSDKSCISMGNQTQVQESLQMAWLDSSTPGLTIDVIAAVQQMQSYLVQQDASCNDTIAFAYSGQATVGLFAGSRIQGQQGILTSLLQEFSAQVESNGISDSLLVQLCSGNGRSSRYALGLVANANGDIAFVQNAVKTWSSGECITTYDGQATWQNITFLGPSASSTLNRTSTNSTLAVTHVQRALGPRATCTTVEAATGDSCSSLAVECGISPADFTLYNPSTTLCSTLTAGQHVCCSAGTLPDFSPQPFANGSCASYLVQAGDYCDELVAEYSLTLDELEDYNNNTWGWMGCTDLQAGQYICLSSGSPPMPAVVSNAVCGPQVPGTPIAPAGTNLSTLNGCPLNACCDIWGQCGTTVEFCTISESPTGAPGTAAVGTNGCISNCGTAIITGSAPAEVLKVGFFEGYNLDRPCINMPITSFNMVGYTDIYLAFAALTTDFAVDISAIEEQFEMFLSMSGFKKVLSIGGWSFSTDPSTYSIFREAVTEANMATTVANIVSFVSTYGLDGINIDWEYPAEPDIPGIPAGNPSDSINYFLFLDELAASMPSGTTISICAPASFWYLQLFPIEAMAAVVDYIIFMTYDLHGQWDYGNAFSDPGCPDGNCLRSDVNLTETLNALSMITKAGVPSNQIIVGVTSYGRSFQMTTAGCYTELCTYTGPLSGAYAGLCTQTPGYIANAEINSILDGNGTVTSGNGSAVDVGTNFLTYLDSNSYSNIVVYDDTQWVGYMDNDNKASREQVYIDLNFCGWSDWAIDLQTYDGDIGNNETVVYVSPSIWTEPGVVAQCTPPCILVLPPSELGSSTVFTFPPYVTSLEVGWTTTVVVTVDGVTSTSIGFTGVIETTTLSIPPLTTTAVNFWNVNITSGVTSFVITPTSSILPPPFTITDVYPAGVTEVPGVRTITPPPSPYSTELGSSQPVPPYTPTYTVAPIISETEVIDGFTIGDIAPVTYTEPGGQIVAIEPSDVVINGVTIVNPTSPTTTDGVTILPPLPVFTTFPSQTIQPFTSSTVPTPTSVTVDGKPEPVIPCTAWFFFICISNKIEGLTLFGFELPGIYPPGGPPLGIDFPPEIEIPPIEWPQITIGWDGVPTYSSMGDDETCETATATDCTTYLSYGLDAAGTTTITSTASLCSEIMGCSASGAVATSATTTTATPTAVAYVIYPVDGTNSGQTLQIFSLLATLKVPSTAPYYVSQSTQGLGVSFWYALLTPAQVDALDANEFVLELFIPKSRLSTLEYTGTDDNVEARRLAKRAVTSQTPALSEMVFISQPSTVPDINDLANEYVYDSSSGSGQFVYSLDYGAALPNPEFASLDITAESWLYPGPNAATVPGDQPMAEFMPLKGGHGSCMLSKIAGATLGVAKKITPIITVINSQAYIDENFLDGLQMIYDHVIANGNQGISTVSMSINVKSQDITQGWIARFGYILNQLAAANVFIVTGAGNEPNIINGYPALYRSPTSDVQVPDLLVVGAVDSTGLVWWRTQQPEEGVYTGSYVEVYAPGSQVSCATSVGGIKPTGEGTSIASATVAGLAAYLKGLQPVVPYTVASLKAEIIALQWARPSYSIPGNIRDPRLVVFPPAIYNGENQYLMCSKNLKRQDGIVPSGCSIGSAPTGGAASQASPITFAFGPPSPTCTTGDGCGILCTGANFCSAPCLLDCGGTPNPDFLDPSDPNSPQNPNNLGSCQTTIATSCQTVSGTQSCFGVLECLAPTASFSLSPPTTLPPPMSAPPTTTLSPPTSTETSPPFPTISGDSGSIYCFSAHNDGTYVPFNFTGATVVINSLCDSSNTLEPGNTKGYTVEYTDPTGINVIAHAQWAQDQAGCSPEASDLMGGDSCLASLDICGASCDGGSDTANYGGGYILNIPDFGCVEWELYAQDSGSGSSACTCNEDGCTSSSPACCADSTCSTSEETVLASVHIIPDSAVLSKA